MLAEDLIKLLETHIGEDIKIVTYTCTEYGEEYCNTCEITGVKDGNLQFQVVSSEEVRYDYYEEPPYEEEPEWCFPEDELDALAALAEYVEEQQYSELEEVNLDELDSELTELLSKG